ncbi:hypothetical protein FGB62_91g118 [Gracilaria domingensis]|nr:hypothetical protein FGB62_91g118 [Gracilaria domingensis]
MFREPPQSHSLTLRVIYTLLAIFATLFVLIYFQSPTSSIHSYISIALSGRSYTRRPTIWLSNQTCSGSFSSAPSEFSDEAFPNALLREAYLDHRPASQRHARHKHGSLPSQRILIALTLHLSVQLRNESVTASLRNAPDVKVHVDDVREIEAHSKGDDFEYSPGKKTKRRFEVYECQLVVTLRSEVNRSDFADYVQGLADDPRVSLELDIPLDRFDGQQLAFNPSFSLGCVFGWQPPDVIRSYAPARIEEPSAMLFCANSLSGNKKAREGYHAEVAHWAARSMQGPVRFDIAVMPVIVDRSISECNMGDSTCLEDVSMQNKELFERVADNVVAELDKIGVPDDVYERIVLMPFCRLGAHAQGFERGDACRGSQRYGQHHVTLMPYTLLGGYYKARITDSNYVTKKWAMMYDLDEYVAFTDEEGQSGGQAVKAGVHHFVAQLSNTAERSELDHVRTAAGSEAETGFNGGLKLKLLRAGAPKNREGGGAVRRRTGLPGASADFVYRR